MKKLVFIQNEQALTTSLKVATKFEKRHDHIIRDIRSLISEIGQSSMFEESTYVHEQNGQEYPMYYMNRDGFLLLAMNFSGEKALKFKLELIKRGNFAPLEELLNINLEPVDAPKSYVYILNLNNKTVKIGKTINPQQRFTQIVNQSGLDILDYVHTVVLDDVDASRIESAMKRRFSKYQTNGEFFKTSFNEVCAELQKYAEIV